MENVGSGPQLQYIVTTTSRPPDDFAGDQRVRLKLNGAPSETLEFKRSTAELRRAGETLCAFLNDEDVQARRLGLYYIALREIGPSAARAAGARR